jgi:hypothetical protein
MVRRILLAALASLVLLAVGDLARAQAPVSSIGASEKHSSDLLATWIDARFEELWKQAGVEQKETVDDATYLRRAYLDLVGKIPSVAQARDFLENSAGDKRNKIVDQLAADSRSNAHLARVWSRIMIPSGSPGVRAGFGGQLQPWLEQQFASRVPYDQFARELITAKPAAGMAGPPGIPLRGAGGSPAAFYVAVGNTPDSSASAISRIFLGVRIGCAKCHNHPFADWRQDDFWGMAAFFAGASVGQPNAPPTDAKITKIKPMESDKEYPVRFLWSDGPAEIPADKFPRDLLADWMVSKQNPNFAAAAVNRVWQQLCGQGLIPHVDDLDQASPKDRALVLDDLARLFVENEYDVQWLIKGICKSRVYQRLSATAEKPAEDSPLSTHRPLKTLTPEQVFDSLEQALMLPVGRGNPESARFNNQGGALMQRLNEAFSDNPDQFRAGIPQALVIMNGVLVSTATDLEDSRTLRAVVEARFLEPKNKVETLYLAALTRRPEPRELDKMLSHVQSQAGDDERREAYADIYWALLNSPEFVLSR